MQSVYPPWIQLTFRRNWFHLCNQFWAADHEKSIYKLLLRSHCKSWQHQQPCLAHSQSTQIELFQSLNFDVLASAMSKTLNVLLVHIKYELTFPQVDCTMNYQFIVNY